MHTLGLLLLIVVMSVFPVRAQADPAAVTATEIARLPFISGPLGTASLISPDGSTFLNITRRLFCLYDAAGTALRCTDMEETVGQRLIIDPDTLVWSPDGKYVAFALNALVYFIDSDIWIFEVETGTLTNITDDSYDGRLTFSGDDIPEDAFLDLAPEWMADGRLSFIRHAFALRQPELWAIAPDGSGAELLGSLASSPDQRDIIWQADWSPDGSTLVFIVGTLDNPASGLWSFDLADQTLQLITPQPSGPEGFLRADFSPDGTSVLLLTRARDMARGQLKPSPDHSSGYYTVALDTGVLEPVPAHNRLLVSVGWLPDGGLLYVAHNYASQGGEFSGLFAAADIQAEPIKILSYPEFDDGIAPFFAPSPQQFRALESRPDGLLLLGTVLREEQRHEITLLIQLTYSSH